jgi:predicted DNA-binding WGR domain protein
LNFAASTRRATCPGFTGSPLSLLFGGVRLLRQWGRIGWRGGRIKIAHYENNALAAEALHRQAERKRRRGYT